jgi:hypothetical protein
MKCPTCAENSPDNWKQLVKEPQGKPGEGLGGGEISMADLHGQLGELPGPKKESWVSLDWMRCANDKCDELIIRIHESRYPFFGGVPIQQNETWIARPRSGANRPVDPIVPEHYRRDFAEAVDILDRSPRMSAVLSRSILTDLLEEYEGKKQYNLADRIDSFNNDTRHPYDIRKNLHYLREIADLSAHTKKNDQDAVITVESIEADWTLTVVERLFKYLIVDRANDKAMRAALDQKIKDAIRKPIKPLPDDPKT